ncbi:hypothetical protein BurJ1DRAFT_2592 [Burkholderiales bacterium JOSHI_001]|nr:hypothetical protein BurJ1DRAFT_2592 [Burkholderiales bacterium JOSHI_001]
MAATLLPQPREAQQLCRLRALRVQRLQARCTQARDALEAAAQAVRQRRQQVAHHQDRLARLAQAVVTDLAPQLPRWAGMAQAQRDRLDDRLERDQYALIDDEQALEQAQDALARAMAELTRALAQEDAVKDLARQAQRARRQHLEQRGERELEDQFSRRPPPAPTR